MRFLKAVFCVFFFLTVLKAGEPVSLKPVAVVEGSHLDFKADGHLVFRSERQWDTFRQFFPKETKIPDVDFEKNFVILGLVGETTKTVKFERAWVRDDRTYVIFHTSDGVATCPYGVVVLPRTQEVVVYFVKMK